MRQEQRQKSLKAFQDFLNISIETKLEQHLHISPQDNVLKLFQEVTATVPAYKAFLRANNINPDSIGTYADFQKLPLINKENYLQLNSLTDLCRYGQLSMCDAIAVSSGSTGKPTFWSRFITDELQVATRFEQIFKDSFEADNKTTLAVICFTLGTWVGGMYTTNCCRYLASKGYPITVVSPGNNQAEIFRVVKELGGMYEQVVLLGYPPFLKDAIDNGIRQGMEWQKYSIKLVMAGEVFSEEWRALVGERVGAKNICYDSASLYGTADAGVLGNETPLSICIRRFLANHPDAALELFGESRLPTLVQYDPLHRFFETTGGTLFFSGDNGIPLLRYHIADTGGIIAYEAMQEFLAKWGFNPLTELASKIHQLPFVYVFGRSNFTVSYFGANIYPENVTVGLEQGEIKQWVTGKFVLQALEDADKNRFLSIVVELAPGIEASLDKENAIALSITSQLLRLNSEFAAYVPSSYQKPQITLKPMGDSEYFPLGVKHRYTRPPEQ